MSPLARKGTWCLLPTTPMLPAATKHLEQQQKQHFIYKNKSYISRFAHK